MRADENKVSNKFKITLTWTSEETMDNGTKVFRFTDEKTGDEYIHYQILPSKSANPTAAKMAKAWLTKMKKYSVDDRLKCEAVFREMNDGTIYRDVDNVLYVVERRNKECVDFGTAIAALKRGKAVARKGWNGKGMFLTLQNGSEVEGYLMRNEPARNYYGDNKVKICPHIDMKAADGTYVVGWAASQTDMLAEDWEIIE